MKTHKPVLDDQWHEAYALYKRGRPFLVNPQSQRYAKTIRRVRTSQPEGYYNQTKDSAHIHPRSLRP